MTKTFEESMNRLNEIVVNLEKNETSLDETVHFFEEGLQLVQQLDESLKGYEAKINELKIRSNNHDESVSK